MDTGLPQNSILLFCYLCESEREKVLYAYIINNRQCKDTKNIDKNATRLGTAQFCYIGSRIGWASALNRQECYL